MYSRLPTRIVEVDGNTDRWHSFEKKNHSGQIEKSKTAKFNSRYEINHI